MPEARSLGRPVWIVIWCVAILVTLICGSWRTPTSVPPGWKLDIQFTGSFVILYLGRFIGPLQVMLSPPIECVLTVATNACCYYPIARAIVFFRGDPKGGES
jgi:hypothetical protein